MTSPASPSETIAKALEGVTPGDWVLGPFDMVWHADDIYFHDGKWREKVPEPRIIASASKGNLLPFDDRANAAYIATCSPARMREVLNELYALRETALQFEAMKREMAEKDSEIARLRDALQFYATPSIYLPHPLGPAFDRRMSLYHSAKDALSGARTLIQGEKQ